MNRLPIALQLHSVREEMKKDFPGTLKKVKDMGYEGVELAELYGHDPKQVEKYLKEAGLTAIAAHVPYGELVEDLPGTVSKYANLGVSYIAIPYLEEDKRYGTKSYEIFLEKIPLIAKECKKYGITLLYHNHDFEFLKTKDGEYVLDALFGQLSGEELQAEPDTCWIHVAGEDPSAYVRKYKGRCPVVHIKDYKTKDPVEFCAVGSGVQDIKGIYEACQESEVSWLVVEQDRHTQYSALEDARMSIEFLKNI